MPGTKCPKCENTTYEIEVEEPLKANFKLAFIRCAKCKTVVSVMDYWNVGTLVKQIIDKLDKK